ncbi:MAG: hypothetical protein M5U34_13545 [Chloroflexi bacterium]|nr:hypothetical protein [Chloroflexota bacterium]
MANLLSACPTPTMLRDNGRRGGTARRGLGQTPDDSLTQVLANWVRQAERSRWGMAIVLSACPTPTMLRDNGRRGGTARRGLGQTPDDGSAPSHPGIRIG